MSLSGRLSRFLRDHRYYRFSSSQAHTPPLAGHDPPPHLAGRAPPPHLAGRDTPPRLAGNVIPPHIPGYQAPPRRLTGPSPFRNIITSLPPIPRATRPEATFGDPYTRFSISLSWLLRHGAVETGLSIRPDGFVRAADIVRAAKSGFRRPSYLSSEELPGILKDVIR